MKQIDFAESQNQINNQRKRPFIWIITSILFHLLILLMIMTYKFHILEVPQPQRVRPDDQVVMWTGQPRPALMQQPPTTMQEPKSEQKQEIKNEAKSEPKEEPNPKQEQKTEQPIVQEIPIIFPGKKGIDKQTLNIDDSLLGQQNLTGIEKKNPEDAIIPQQQESQLPTEMNTNSLKDKSLQEKKTEVYQTDKQAQIMEPLYTTTPLVFSKANHFVSHIPKQMLHTKSKPQQTTTQDQHQFVPKPTKQKAVRVASFKDLGIGHNENMPTFGNSQNIRQFGNSLKPEDKDSIMRWNNYAKSTFALLKNSFHFHPQLKLIIQQKHQEPLCFYIKINRKGQLLEARMIKESKNPLINHAIIDCIKGVGLFNTFSKFTKENEWECNILL